MKVKVAGVSLSLVLLLLAVTPVFAGHTSSQLERAGWTCITAGPNDWVHCFPPGAFASSSSISVKVFSIDGSTFLGTEILIRADLYNGRSCVQEGGGDYGDLPSSVSGLPFDYRACHRF